MVCGNDALEAARAADVGNAAAHLPARFFALAAPIRMARDEDALVTVWAGDAPNAAAKLPFGAGRLDAFASRIGMTRGDFASETSFASNAGKTIQSATQPISL